MSFVLGHRRTDRPLWRRMPRILRFVARLLFRQESLLFQPGSARPRSPADLGQQAAAVELPGGVHGWWLASPTAAEPVDVLYLPGAIGSLDHDLASVLFLHRLGAAVLAIDYPGYGRSAGRPSLAGCRRAAADAWAWLAEAGHGGRPIVYGRSFGGALAAELAAEPATLGAPPAGLVLHNTFTSVADMVTELFPRWLVRLGCRVHLDAAAAAARCPAPVLVLHARHDEVIAARYGDALFAAAAAPKRFVSLPGGHFDDGWRHDPAARRALVELLRGEVESWPAGTAA